MKTLRLASVGIAAVLLGACAEAPAGSAADQTTPADPFAEILERVSSPRLLSLTADENVVTVQGLAEDRGADLTRTLWYENVAAAAYAEVATVAEAARTVTSADGKTLAEERDPVKATSRDAFEPSTDTEQEIADILKPSATSLDVEIAQINYVDLFGGVAEVVIEPSDPSVFIAEAGTKLPILLGRLVRDQRPYLVTVVGADDQPDLVIGYVPGVGGDGQGLGWVTPGVETDAIWGTPITPDQIDEDGS